MLRLATFKAQWQKNAKNFEPYYRDLLNQLEIKQMESVLRIGEGTWFFINYISFLPLRSEKAGRFYKLFSFARSDSIVTRGSVSLSCVTTSHTSCFSKS